MACTTIGAKSHGRLVSISSTHSCNTALLVRQPFGALYQSRLSVHVRHCPTPVHSALVSSSAASRAEVSDRDIAWWNLEGGYALRPSSCSSNPVNDASAMHSSTTATIMRVAYTRTVMPSGLPPSPTLTNPDMILPYQSAPANRWQQSSSTESSPETPRHTQRFPDFASSFNDESTLTRSDVPEAKRRVKPAGQSLSPFRNGVLSRPGRPTRARSVTEREKGGDGRIRYENSRLSYRPVGTPETTITSSPTLKDQYSPNRVIIIEDDEQSEAAVESNYAPDNTYRTPSILIEDESNPNSHTAMSKRAEAILANAKKRLTVGTLL